jgi:hypothetical protein
MRKGELVSVRADMLIYADEERMLRDHGYLWRFIEHPTPNTNYKDRGSLGLYTSLATGRYHHWYDSEVERADAGS